MTELTSFEQALPAIFFALMGIAVIAYSILDGYDLGVGILLSPTHTTEHDRDTMIASIGPFWDANETWLVLAVGLLLIAFPAAHSIILQQLYLPTAIMLIGLILRGVSFDFRAKAAIDHKFTWDRLFFLGSLITSLAQGYMLGQYVVGFQQSASAILFSLLSAFGVAAAYSYIGASWLILKTEGDLQQTAMIQAKWAGRIMFLGVLAVCLVNPLVNARVYDRWFEFPLVMFVLLIPLACIGAFIGNDLLLSRFKSRAERNHALPFFITVAIFLLCFSGIAFSFFPEIIPGQMTVWQAASAPESLSFIFYGAVLVIPVILGYTAFSYIVFRGKSTDLKYY